MDDDARRFLKHLLTAQRVAALGTRHREDPQVTMVPFVLDMEAPEAPTLLIHVSGLATHTRDLQVHPTVSLMVMDTLVDPEAAQALGRVTVQGDARFLERGTEEDDRARAAYLARFPSAEITFGLADFSMVRIQPHSARLVAGFGRAFGFTRETFAQALQIDKATP